MASIFYLAHICRCSVVVQPQWRCRTDGDVRSTARSRSRSQAVHVAPEATHTLYGASEPTWRGADAPGSGEWEGRLLDGGWEMRWMWMINTESMRYLVVLKA